MMEYMPLLVALGAVALVALLAFGAVWLGQWMTRDDETDRG